MELTSEAVLGAIRNDPGVTYQELRRRALYANIDGILAALINGGQIRIERGTDSYGRDNRYFALFDDVGGVMA